MTIKLGAGFKVTKDGKIVKDDKALEAKLDVSTRLKKRNSRKVKPVRRSES